MALYAADGSWNVSVVDGSTYTGVQAPDGSYNVFHVDGSVYTGLYAPCGAFNVFVSTGGTGYYAPCGALNVSQSPYTRGTVSVTVVSGSLNPTPPTGIVTYYIYGF